MYKTAKPFYIQTVTPTHIGSGSDLGIVDMPIQRESHTGFPKIEGSSLKGAIREAVEQNSSEELKIHTIFGYDDTNASSEAKKAFENNKDKFAGAIGFSDARILLFPVKSVKGVYAYITSPLVIKRYKEELENIVKDSSINFDIPTENSIPKNSKIKLDDENVIILEEYSFEVTQDSDENESTTKLANFLAEQTGINEIKEKLIVLDDNDFKDFVKMFTEVITRTKIDNLKGTVKDRALFTEEYLPAETVMYSFIMASPIMADINEVKDLNNENDVLNFFQESCPDVIQIGGNATIGKGVCKIVKNFKIKDSSNG